MRKMNSIIGLITIVFLAVIPALSFAQASSPPLILPDMPIVLEKMIENHYLPMVMVGMGSFTFADSQLPSPFSRWFEDELRLALSRTTHLKLFDKQVAAAMDPSIRKLYSDFFGTDRADSILYGKYFLDERAVLVHRSLSDLSTGGLIADMRYIVPLASVPGTIEISPSPKTVQNAVALSQLTPGKGDLIVSIAADRGIGATYRDGETLTLFVTSNKDAYLKIYHVDVNGIAQLIWPNRYGGSGRITAGEAMKFPGPNDGFKYLLGKPYGTEYIKAVASTVPFATVEADFTDLAGPAPTVITRGLFVVSASNATQAEALLVYEILP